jgi:hypothetical protein
MDRQDIQVNGKLNHKAALLAKVFSVRQLEALRKRMIPPRGSKRI